MAIRWCAMSRFLLDLLLVLPGAAALVQQMRAFQPLRRHQRGDKLAVPFYANRRGRGAGQGHTEVLFGV